MQIQKISKNKLEVLINIQDLKQNNISFEDFMIASQDLYQNVLNTVFEKMNFKIIKIESFAILSKKLFILIISTNKRYISNTYLIAKFNDFNTLCSFCKSINIKTSSALYYENNWYYLRIKINNMKDYKKTYYSIKEFTNYITNNYNKNLIIQDQAIEILKRYV